VSGTKKKKIPRSTSSGTAMASGGRNVWYWAVKVGWAQ